MPENDKAEQRRMRCSEIGQVLWNQRGRGFRERQRAAGSALRVHEVIKERPVTSLQDVSSRAALSFPVASAGMALLEDEGIAKELTGKKRNRVFGYSRYLAILAEGTETL